MVGGGGLQHSIRKPFNWVDQLLMGGKMGGKMDHTFPEKWVEKWTMPSRKNGPHFPEKWSALPGKWSAAEKMDEKMVHVRKNGWNNWWKNQFKELVENQHKNQWKNCLKNR